MPRPNDVPVIDLMMELPTGQAGMGMAQARALTRDKGTDDFSHHPAQYLFKDAPERMSKKWDVDQIVSMMDEYGVAMAQIGVNPSSPGGALGLFDQRQLKLPVNDN